MIHDKPAIYIEVQELRTECDRLENEVISLRAKLAEAEKDVALLNEADKVGHVDARFASIREELEWVKAQNFGSLDAAIAKQKEGSK